MALHLAREGLTHLRHLQNSRRRLREQAHAHML